MEVLVRELARFAWVAAFGIGLLTAGCGSDGPTSSSGPGGVVVEGVMLGGSASVSAADTSSAAQQAKKVTVKIEGTSLSVDVSANGTFKFTGVPSGTFTLVFLSDGVEIGRVVVSAADGSEVNIVVQVENSVLVVVDIKIEASDPSTPPSGSDSCGVNGGNVGQGIELQGDVESGSSAAFKLSVSGRASFPIDVNAGSASFKCNGNPKNTSDAECKASVKAGAKVHVRGTLMTCAASSAQVTATEVKVHKD
jgi:hypothetical protein